MTSTDFEIFAKRLFTAFPDYWEWLSSTSPDPKGTQASWRDTLRDCTLPECLLVLDSWISGKRPLPKAYDRSQVALTVKQAVMWERDAEKKKQATQAESLQYTRPKDPYTALPGRPDVSGLAERAFLRRMDWVAGKITKEELDSGNEADRELKKQGLLDAM